MRWKYKIQPYCFIAPFFIVFSYFYFIPIFELIRDSFTNFDMFTKRDFIGWENYKKLFHDTEFLISIKNTFIYTIGSLFPALAIGLLLAVGINSPLIKTKVTRMVIFMPHVVSMVAVSMIWLYMYSPGDGVLSTIAEKFGVKGIQWLYDPKLAMLCLILMQIWKSIGYYMIVFLSGLKGIAQQYYEAAQIDGANAVNIFFRITLPLLKPTTTFLFITGIIDSFNVFEQVNIMTDGGPLNTTTTMVHQIYNTAFTEYKLGYASAMSVVLLFIIIVISMINFRMTREEQ